MTLDVPVIDYGHQKGKNKRSLIASSSEVNELNDITEAWERKHKGRTMAGQTVSLSDFLSQKL